jgi:hypothetical protein
MKQLYVVVGAVTVAVLSGAVVILTNVVMGPVIALLVEMA